MLGVAVTSSYFRSATGVTQLAVQNRRCSGSSFERRLSCYGFYSAQGGGDKSVLRSIDSAKVRRGTHAPRTQLHRSGEKNVGGCQSAGSRAACRIPSSAKPQRACVPLVGRGEEASWLAGNQVTGTNDSGQRPWRQRYTQHTTAAGSLHGANLSASAPSAADAGDRGGGRRDVETCCAEGRHVRNALHEARTTVDSLVFPPADICGTYGTGHKYARARAFVAGRRCQNRIPLTVSRLPSKQAIDRTCGQGQGLAKRHPPLEQRYLAASPHLDGRVPRRAYVSAHFVNEAASRLRERKRRVSKEHWR